MEKRHKCPKCSHKIFKIVETVQNGKIAVMCNSCGTVFVGFQRNVREDPVVASAIAAAQVPL